MPVDSKKFKVIALTGEEYPALLKEISDPPNLLYYNGTLPSASEKLIAVVGSRKPSAYGREAAMFLTRELCRAGFSIVSGMALGIDGIAQETALAEGVKTYAVMGSGIDVIYPAEHKSLYQRITGQGAVMTEYVPGTKPRQYTFPERNRIIAGMTLGTLIIEAREKSGSIITGRLALEYNREVFAVPGPIFASSFRGSHFLLKNGAKLVENINDILEEYGFKAEGVQERLFANASDEERRILELMKEESKHIDAIVAELKIPAAEIHSALTMLEIKDLVQHLGGNIYGLKR
jgi:DNA processing protein